MREPTAEEIKWWKRFEKCIKDMPETMEIITNNIGIISAEEGEISKQEEIRKVLGLQSV
jgi:hypothetical protein